MTLALQPYIALVFSATKLLVFAPPMESTVFWPLRMAFAVSKKESLSFRAQRSKPSLFVAVTSYVIRIAPLKPLFWLKGGGGDTMYYGGNRNSGTKWMHSWD